MLICGQFIAKYLNLWSTLIFVSFENSNFPIFWGPLNLLGPSKKSNLLDSWPLNMPLKTRPWINLFKNIVPYLMGLVASYFYKWRSFQAYVIVGENDSPAFISQAKEFCRKLKNSGFTQAILEIIDEKDHFDLVEKLCESEDVLTQLMLKCIK